MMLDTSLDLSLVLERKLRAKWYHRLDSTYPAPHNPEK